MGERKAPKLTRVQLDVLGIAVDRGNVNYYQAAEAGAQGQTLASLVRKSRRRAALRCENIKRNFAAIVALAAAFVLIKSAHTA
ncbi:hypothetical protein [Bosea sp. (in: a-proteobacteria)]|uniref:hypothetical protein n=1 Tax=Bosea sp. (in: a-proteobacteria) TaxID=1871050 RepID=UPI00086A12BD|nr:hypothetical protein [Bosea sp. (in: a-proteobacteria)]MBN9440500.1 hypothetical protein [Bosea sp. (in: a-proteobacteria)]ODT55486.1 MAG: hypothetical protein ABS59_03440 [Methylobacterium sp. SCN 67-24]